MFVDMICLGYAIILELDFRACVAIRVMQVQFLCMDREPEFMGGLVCLVLIKRYVWVESLRGEQVKDFDLVQGITCVFN